MLQVARMRRVFRGNHFRASSLRADERLALAPFLGIDHALMSGTPPSVVHDANAAVLSYLFLDSETGSAQQAGAEEVARCTAP